MTTLLLPMPHLNRPSSQAGQVCCISLKDNDLVRLFAMPHNIVPAVKSSIEQSMGYGAVHFSNENNKTFYELKINGDPWNNNSLPEADRGRLTLVSIIRTMAVNGWNILQAIDMSKRGSETASETIFFQRIDTRLGAVYPNEADMFGMSFQASDSLRVITSAAVAHIPAIRQAILAGWKLGLKKEQIVGVAHEFVLKGNPWTPSERDSVAVALLLSHILAYVRSQGFKLYASINMNKESKNSDFWVFRRAKRTKKVGVVGKYGIRYGASLRKQVKKMEITQHSKYTCTFCGRDAVKRQSVGIWKCRGCKKTMAGGAWTLSTTAAATVRSTTRRLREIMEV
ncbi:60S ribosomal protein L43 [Linnemannia schmuckeri]|uniref:60S ribosomal protein L43 n=1 Tax=Linnemannia schmuckeri TaxID=64567 RepID=A0A9P5S926_9FUNG|nr:60S ribosomal protein L43 [Linnemannia schmuckeri]